MERSIQLSVGERLREMRGNRTRRDVARLAGITEGALYKLEADLFVPSVSTVMSLADIYGVSSDQILGREEYSHDSE